MWCPEEKGGAQGGGFVASPACVWHAMEYELDVVCVCVCARACVRVCVCACVCNIYIYILMRGEAGVWHAMEYKLDVAVKFSEDDMDKLVHTALM